MSTKHDYTSLKEMTKSNEELFDKVKETTE